MNGSGVKLRATNLLSRLRSSCLGSMVLAAVLASSIVSQLGVTVTSAVTAACLAAGLTCVVLILSGLRPFDGATAVLGLLALVMGCSSTYGQDFDWMLQTSLAVGLLLLALSVRPVSRRLLSGIPEPVRIGILASLGVFSMSCALRLCGIVDVGDGGSLTMAGIFDPVFVDALISLYATVILRRCSVPAAGILGILIATFAGIPLGLTQASSGIFKLPDLSLVVASGEDLANSLSRILLSLASPETAGLVASLALCLLALASEDKCSSAGLPTRSAVCGLLTVICSFLGMPGLFVPCEDSRGRAAVRSIDAIVLAVLMLVLSTCSPLIACVPASALFGPLLLVSIGPLGALSRLDFDDPGTLLPVVGMVACVLVTGSLAWAVAAGFLLDLGLKLGSGQARTIGWVTMALDLLCLLFVLAVTGL